MLTGGERHLKEPSFDHTFLGIGEKMKTRNKTNPYKELDKKEHPLKALYPAAAVIYRLLEKKGKTDILGNKETIRMLGKAGNADDEVRLGGYKTISFILLTLIFTGVLTTLCLLARESSLLEGNRLKRADTGGGASEYELMAETEGTEGDKEISVTVSEQKCPDDKLDMFFEEAVEKLKAAILADNASVNEITGNIKIIKEIPGTSIKVKFDDPDPKYIYYDGTVRFENITEPVIVTLTAELTYFDEIRIVSFPIRLMPREQSVAELFELSLLQALTDSDNATLDENFFILPETVDGKKIGWNEKKNKTAGIIGLLGIAAALGVIPARNIELKKQCKLREQEMIRDYPDIISKLSLLLTAGMTSRGAWEKICLDYVKQRESSMGGRNHSGKKGSQKDRKNTRYAYEEMLKAAAQMNLGRSESEVYEEFANRCQVAVYQRLGSLLSKNLRRGSREITVLLQTEAENAMEDRRQGVRQRGEEVGTKLLLPMFGMFGIVVAIVVVPAIGSMGL